MRHARYLSIAAAVLVTMTAAAQSKKATIEITRPAPQTAVTQEVIERVSGARINVWKDLSLVPLGTTDAAGALSFDPGLLSGKPKMDARINECPNQTIVVNLFPDGVDRSVIDQQCEDRCKCGRRVGAFWWGDDVTLNVTGATPFFNFNPPNIPAWALFGGAGGGAALLFGRGDDPLDTLLGAGPGGTTTPGGGGTGTPIRTYNDIIGSYSVSSTPAVTGSCGFNPFNGTLTIGGTAGSSTFVIIENATFNYAGSTTQNGDIFNLSGSGSGSIPGLGSYTGSLTGTVNGTNVQATETLNFGCGRVTNTMSGTKR